MDKIVLAAAAANEIDEILDWSQAKFGELSRVRYATLLDVAVRDVAADIRNPLIKWKRIRAGTIGLYHIANSRTHVGDPPGQVSKPRHLIVFRVADEVLHIVGVIHDSQNVMRKVGAIRF